jgi:hypothetical protein
MTLHARIGGRFVIPMSLTVHTPAGENHCLSTASRVWSGPWCVDKTTSFRPLACGLLRTFRSATNPESELRVTSSLSALAVFVSGKFVSCLRASAGFLVGKYEWQKSLNASKVSSSYFSYISYPLNMSGIPCHCSRRDRNDFHVNLAVMKMGVEKRPPCWFLGTMTTTSWMTLRCTTVHVIHCLNHC